MTDMRKSTSYTCQRCLQALGKAQNPRSAVRSLRGLSTKSRPESIIRPRPKSQYPQRVLGRRTSSVAEQQGLSAGNGMSTFPSATGAQKVYPEEGTFVLRPNDLFNPLSTSPLSAMRKRAAYMKLHAHCPHPDHRQTRHSIGPDDPEGRKPSTGGLSPAHVDFECPDCGIPVYCSEEHWADDYESHLEICDQLREINEDDHDMRSGRFFSEFHYPPPSIEEALVNFTNWDTMFYTREFRAVNDERSMRQVSRILTYPITLGSVLHELSPYTIKSGGRLTVEGLKSLSALRYTLHPPRDGGGADIGDLKPQAPPVRIFVLGARAESSLPREAWIQLCYLFPRARFHIIMIGPESMANRDDEFPLPARTATNPFGGIVEDRISHELKITTFVEYYQTMHKANYFHPYDPYFDCFMLYHPGLGHPASSHEWAEVIPQLLETKVPILVTGYSPYDMERDAKFVKETVGGEMDMLLEPGENIFRSLRWDLNDLDPQDVSCGNWGLWGFRGKRYETTRKDA